MTTQAKTPLLIDFTAPKQQKIALGALRSIVGAVFGAVVYFAVIGGLLAVEARTGKDASITVAFFAVAGFAAGFSERCGTGRVRHAAGRPRAACGLCVGRCGRVGRRRSHLLAAAGPRGRRG